MGKDISGALLPEFYKRATKVTTAYKIADVNGTDYYYLVNTSDISYGGHNYEALAIKRTSIKSEEGTVLNELEIGLDNVDLAFRSMVMNGLLDNKKITIYLAFLSYSVSWSILGLVTIFEGYTDAPKGDELWLTLTVRPFSILEREFPRRIFQEGCNWTFCSPFCGLDLGDYQVDTTLNSESNGITLACTHGQATNYFLPGYVEILDGDYDGEIRPVFSNDASSVIVRIPFGHTIDNGTAIRVQKLCFRNIDTCENVYSNETEFGGFPNVPKQPIL